MTSQFQQTKQAGAVSMLTVIFFVLFLSVISVSFLRLVNDERQRSLMNELSASALAAAEAGIEDGKRVLLYCMNNQGSTDSNVTSACNALEQSEDCSGILNNFGNLLQTTTENGGVEGVVDGDNEKYQQYYPCMFINQMTNEVEFLLSALDSKSPDSSASVVIPFDVVQGTPGNYVPAQNVKTFDLSWHLIGTDLKYSDGSAGTVPTKEENPAKSGWTGPAMVRVEMVKVPTKSTFDLDALTANAYAVTLRPLQSGQSATDAITLLNYAPKTEPNASNPPIVNVKCQSTQNYQCTARISYNGSALDLSNNQYYLKVTALYRDAHISVGNILNAAGAGTYKFNAIQPLIDVTGRVNDTYRRVVARVAPNAAMAGELFFPEYAIESATKVCKKMKIVKEGSVPGSEDLCAY